MKDLKEVATVSGKSGLFKVLKPTRTGLILESMDDQKRRFPVNADQRVSILDEISIYTTTSDGSVPIEEVLKKIYAEFGDDPGLTTSADSGEMKAFLQHIVPEYDEARVYVSDIKKLIAWYYILLHEAPELFKEKPKKSEKQEEKDKSGPEKKPTAKKAKSTRSKTKKSESSQKKKK